MSKYMLLHLAVYLLLCERDEFDTNSRDCHHLKLHALNPGLLQVAPVLFDCYAEKSIKPLAMTL